VLAALVLFGGLALSAASDHPQAHRHGCHRNHTCPSGHATYRWRRRVGRYWRRAASRLPPHYPPSSTPDRCATCCHSWTFKAMREAVCDLGATSRGRRCLPEDKLGRFPGFLSTPCADSTRRHSLLMRGGHPRPTEATIDSCLQGLLEEREPTPGLEPGDPDPAPSRASGCRNRHPAARELPVEFLSGACNLPPASEVVFAVIRGVRHDPHRVPRTSRRTGRRSHRSTRERRSRTTARPDAGRGRRRADARR
jgi:hypothetical protein